MTSISHENRHALGGTSPSSSVLLHSELPAVRSRTIPRISAWAGLQRYRNDRAGILTELGDERVDVVESALGPIRLVFITEADLARSVLIERNDSFRKGPAVSRHLVELLGDGLLTSTGETHRRHRKVLAPKFKPGHIAGDARTMIELTEAMIARWRDRQPDDFDKEITGLTMSIAARTMFGAGVSTEDIDALHAGITVANHWFIKRSISLGNVPAWFPTPGNLALHKATRAMDRVVYRLLAEHRAGSGEDDVLAALLAARDDDGVGMSDALIRDQVLTFFLAGHETIATTMGWAYRLLSDMPDVVDRIAAEASQVFGPAMRTTGAETQTERPGQTPDARQLVYTRAVLQEIMRLWPSAYMIGRQALRDVVVGDYPIRAGSYVVVNTLGMHRRADYFPDPLAFRCERFLRAPTWPRAAYQPFGAGPRVCIGNHFAMMEGTLVLALLCRAMRFVGRLEREAAGPLDADPMITLRPRTRVPFAIQWRNV